MNNILARHLSFWAENSSVVVPKIGHHQEKKLAARSQQEREERREENCRSEIIPNHHLDYLMDQPSQKPIVQIKLRKNANVYLVATRSEAAADSFFVVIVIISFLWPLHFRIPKRKANRFALLATTGFLCSLPPRSPTHPDQSPV